MSKICQQCIFLLQIMTKKMHISSTFLLQYCRNCSIRNLSFFLVLPYYSDLLMVLFWTSFKHFALTVTGSANQNDSSALLSVWLTVSSLPQECLSFILKDLPITIVQGLTKSISIPEFQNWCLRCLSLDIVPQTFSLVAKTVNFAALLIPLLRQQLY